MKKFPSVFLYFINWNDSFYLPFIAKHYGAFCERIVMYDNHSTDNSVQLAKSFGFEVRTFGIEGVLDDREYLKIKNHHWKEAKGEADYVIVCDADEFLYHPNIQKQLLEYKTKGVTLIRTSGYDMYSQDLPEKEMLEIKTGVRMKKYAKKLIFSPDHVEINYNSGCHTANPTGKIKKRGSFYVLHYRNIGGYGRIHIRHQEYIRRLSEHNITGGHGKEYLFEEERKRLLFEKGLKKAKELKFLK